MRKNIDIGAVLAAGRELELHETVAVPDFGSYRFPRPANADLLVARLERGLQVRGTLDITYTGACDRCLEDVEGTLRLGVDERIGPADEPHPLAETNVLSGDKLDLADLVRQLIDSALPMSLLCDDECAGLCTQCGQKRTVEGCDCATD